MEMVKPDATQARSGAPRLEDRSGMDWTVHEGRVRSGGAGNGFQENGVSDLTYTNPFKQKIERAWYKGQFVFAIEGEVMHLSGKDEVKSAKEYQPVYDVELNDNGWRKSHKPVKGQYNIYASIPGDKDYSAVWKFYYVIVPKDYEPNSLRSEQDCLDSGYEIRVSNYYQN